MNTARTTEDQNGLIIIEEEQLKESFTQIPNTILRRPELSAGAKLTYMVLLSYAWQQDSCFPGQSTLAADLGAGRRSVIRYLQKLQQLGLLRVKRRGLGKTNLYTLARWDRSGSARMASPEMPSVTHREVSDRHRKNTHENDTQNNEDSPSNQFDGKEQQVSIERPTVRGLTRVGDALRRHWTGQGVRHGGMRLHAGETSISHTEERHPEDRRGQSAARSPQIEALMEEFSSELGDSVHRASNSSQALRLWAQCGLSEQSFVSRLYEARSRTRQAALVSGRNPGGSVSPIRKRMPYFFACLRDLIVPTRDAAVPPDSEPNSKLGTLRTGDVRV